MPTPLDIDLRTGRGRLARTRLANLWRVRTYLRPYYWQMAWMLAAAAAGTAAFIAVPMVVRQVVDGPVHRGEPGALLLLGSLALTLGLLEALLAFLRRWVQAASALGMETALRRDLYQHLQRLPVAFGDQWQSGQLLSRVTSDLSVLRRFLSFGLIFGIVNLATFLTVVVLLLRLHWPLGLVVGVGAVPLFIISKRFSTRYFSIARQLQDQQGDLATTVEEAARGIRVIRAFGRRDHMSGLFGAGATQLHDTAVGKTRVLAATWSQFDAVPNISMAVVLALGAVEVANGRLTLGALVAFVSLQAMLVWPVDSLGWIISTGQEATTAADRVYEVLDVQPVIVDRPGAVAVDPGSVRGHVRFEGVGFSYPGSDTPVLDRVDLDIAPGETLAVVGATGCGKTSLVTLLPRLYEVTTGRITIDGRDVRDHTLASLRSIVGFAFEDPTLFSMSVRENLTLGRPDAGPAEIAEALAIAQADFVHELPWGLETRVGEQGLSLSGGQRQRLALARAVLGRPRILVLDDPLSALDVHTEALVEAALAGALRSTTAVIVAHRPSTVALADRVALLANGTVAAVGTHSHLLATVPAYRSVLSAATPDDEEAAA